ncbi:carbohydrate ABC transporter permease [Paenibacillus aceris]|uniref:Multiple sugar transport system permease protein n=1 Tax=Paenibacillus aceris TaxID=869555 RepID=A0ABS4I3G4_9BACL|nr:carbohydrate ABC transporter permease [Paenibacillus aceris]MBP1965270.1 multiple sugar transport system permease protein [Paenibacillus aceris]NHW35953.1 carbohydrate ABC transporter permease [Paenibacillus aceris]
MAKSSYLIMKVLGNILLYVSAALFIFPLYWMVTGAFKNQSSSVKIPPDWIPTKITMANFYNLINDGSIFYWLYNSGFVSVVATVGVVLIASMAGYALTKRKFKGSEFFFSAVLIAMFIPRQITLVPLFTMMRDLGLVNNLASAILPVLTIPFAVFMMKQFSESVPTELLEAGRIDGCSEIGLFFKLFFPIIKPAIGALAIFTFTYAWNDYLWQLIMLSDKTKMTINVGISTLVSEYVANYGLQMAAASLGFIPVFLIFISFQKYFVKGITLGGVKG